MGAHMSIQGGVQKALDRGESIGCNVVQIFTQNQLRWQSTSIPDQDAQMFLRKKRLFFSVLAHGSYLVNPASPGSELYEKSVLALEQEMRRCKRLRIDFLIIHPGNHRTSGIVAGINRIAETLQRLGDKHLLENTQILLETTAGQGSAIGGRFEELRDIFALTGDFQSSIGICLDTCHIFAAGYDIRKSSSYTKVMEVFDEVIGLSKLKAIHLNDSREELGSRRDRHEHIGKGKIGIEGFRCITTDPRLMQIPMCLETPKDKNMSEDVQNLALLRSLRIFKQNAC